MDWRSYMTQPKLKPWATWSLIFFLSLSEWHWLPGMDIYWEQPLIYFITCLEITLSVWYNFVNETWKEVSLVVQVNNSVFFDIHIETCIETPWRIDYFRPSFFFLFRSVCWIFMCMCALQAPFSADTCDGCLKEYVHTEDDRAESWE